MIWLALFALGCKGKADDTDTQVVADTGDSGDTEWVPLHSYTGFTSKADGVPADGDLKVGLVQTTPGDLGAGPMLAVGPYAGTGVFSVGLPDEGPPAEQIGDLWATAHPGLKGAIYAPIVWDDADHDGAWTEGEALFGINDGTRWLLWLDGTLPSGWTQGYTLATLDTHDPDAEPTDFSTTDTEAEIVIRGGPSEELLTGTWTGATPDGAVGMVGIDMHLVTDGAASAFHVLDAPFSGGKFTATLDSRPDSDHFYTELPSGLWYAREMNLVYDDVDADGKYTEGTDTLTNATACNAGNVVFDRYVNQPTTLAQALELDAKGWSSGWRAYQIDGGSGEEVEIEKGETKYLEVDPGSCVFSY